MNTGRNQRSEKSEAYKNWLKNRIQKSAFGYLALPWLSSYPKTA